MATKLKNFSTTAASNNSTPPDGFPEGMAPSDVNDSMRENMARYAEWYQDAGWIHLHTGTYASGTTLTITGDVTGTYVSGRRIKAAGTTPFEIYGSITSSVYSSPDTTVTVSWDSGSLDATLNLVEVSILEPNHSADISEQISYNAQTGTTYTITSSDNGKIVTCSNASSITVTLPENATESLPQGFWCIIRQQGAGQVTVAIEGSDSLNAPAGTKTSAQYSDIFIDLQTSGTPNTWHAIGHTTT